MQVSQQLRDALCAQPIELTVFKPVALDLLRLIAEPDIVFFNITKIIKEDQALSAHVLKMANSPSYMGRSRCETIENAAIRLGSQQIANIAIAASHASLHASENPLVHSVMQDLWLHSHACALGCRSIVLKTGHQRFADHAYLAGLLHDIGKLSLLKALERISSPDDLNRELLRSVFSELHVTTGTRVMDHLNLPRIYRDIAAHHHFECRASDDFLLTVVRFVNHTSRTLELNQFPTQDLKAGGVSEGALIELDQASLEKLEETMSGSRFDL